MDKHVFISYKREDGDFAEVLINRIEKQGFKTWQDNDRLHAGEDWRIEIDHAIKNAFALIVIMTPEAKASEYVTYEWAFAWGAGVKLIPVVLKHTSLHPRLEALQYLDFTNHTARPWDKLINAIKNASNDLQAISVLIEALHAKEYNVRSKAAEELGKIGDATAVPALSEGLHDEDSSVRHEVAVALGKIGDATAVPALFEGLHDENPNVRREVVTALGKVGDASAVPFLSEALHDENARVRSQSAEALGKIGDASAVPFLSEALRDENEYVRHDAANALKRIGTPEALIALQEKSAKNYSE